MIYISLLRDKLLSKLAIANNISQKKSEVNFFTLSKVLINSDELKIEVINRDLSLSSKIVLEHAENIDQELGFLINTDQFYSTIQTLPDEKIGIEIDIEKSTLLIQGSKSKHKVRIQKEDIDDYRIFELADSPELKIKTEANDFATAVKASFVSVGQTKNVYEPRFLNICLAVQPEVGALEVVSTDRYRITRTKIKTDYQSQSEPKNYLILPKNLQVALSIVENSSYNIEFYSDYIAFKTDTDTLISRYGEGTYPDYNKIIPQSFAANFSINTKDIQEALKQAYLLARNNVTNKSINLTIDPTKKTMVVHSELEDGSMAEVEVELLNYEGSPDAWVQSFNADYLREYINTISTEEFLWESNPGKPSVLSPKDMKDWQLYLVSGLK